VGRTPRPSRRRNLEGLRHRRDRLHRVRRGDGLSARRPQRLGPRPQRTESPRPGSSRGAPGHGRPARARQLRCRGAVLLGAGPCGCRVRPRRIRFRPGGRRIAARGVTKRAAAEDDDLHERYLGLREHRGPARGRNDAARTSPSRGGAPDERRARPRRRRGPRNRPAPRLRVRPSGEPDGDGPSFTSTISGARTSGRPRAAFPVCST
jgi:hypothetical protein